MKLDAFPLHGHKVDARPAPLERPWMDASPEKFAYRCLPLNIANQHGWEVLCPGDVTASWDGTDVSTGVFTSDNHVAMGHFGCGILTFHIPFLIRTEPGYDMYVTGPVNMPKDAIAPLTGIVETDWNPATFTMNWKFTRPNTPVSFAKGEPIATIFPIKRGLIEQFRPAIRDMRDDPEVLADHTAWSNDRAAFLEDLRNPRGEARKRGWQKDYFQAKGAKDLAAPHRTKVKLRPFAKGK